MTDTTEFERVHGHKPLHLGGRACTDDCIQKVRPELTDMEWLREMAQAHPNRAFCTWHGRQVPLPALAETVLALVEALHCETADGWEGKTCLEGRPSPSLTCNACQALTKAAALREGTNPSSQDHS